MDISQNNQLTAKDIPTFVAKITTNYASVTKMDLTPKREQGLIMDCVDDLNLTDYTCAVGEIV